MASQLSGSLIDAVAISESDDGQNVPEARLIAAMHELLGSAYRRQDQLDDAIRHHTIAHRIRETKGSVDERRETVASLGTDAFVMRRYEEAVRWQRHAVELATLAEHEKEKHQAVAWSSLADTYLESDQLAEAVESARSSCQEWRRHDATSVTATAGDARLAEVLLHAAQNKLVSASDVCSAMLNEAIELLATCQLSFRAFGAEYTADADRCAAQLDFAERLRASFST